MRWDYQADRTLGNRCYWVLDCLSPQSTQKNILDCCVGLKSESFSARIWEWLGSMGIGKAHLPARLLELAWRRFLTAAWDLLLSGMLLILLFSLFGMWSIVFESAIWVGKDGSLHSPLECRPRHCLKHKLNFYSRQNVGSFELLGLSFSFQTGK